MSYIPLNYEQINIAAGTYTPSTIKAYNNEAFRFWERALFQRATSVIKIKMPSMDITSSRQHYPELISIISQLMLFSAILQ